MKVSVAAAIALSVGLVGCAARMEPQHYYVSYPWSGLKLSGCRAFGTFSECQLVSTTTSAYAPWRLGPVQQKNRRFQILSDSYQYQITACHEIDRVNRPLPNYVCRIVGYRTGADAGSVFVKGGTAVNLAKYLGVRGQIYYRWKRDPWERKRG